MRRAGLDVMPVAARLARDTDPGVRREVALSLRDQPAAAALNILVDIARGFDGKDRTYLEALGTGATGKEPALYERLQRDLGVKTIRSRGPPRSRALAWRLHVPAAVADLTARARSPTLSLADRRFAVDTLAFIKDPAASKAMLESVAAEQPGARAGDGVAVEPHVQRLGGSRPAAGAQGGRDLRSRHGHAARVGRAAAAGGSRRALDRRKSSASPGDAARGKTTATRCVMCHAIGGTGAELGPALDGWGRGKSAEVIATALIRSERGDRARLRGDGDPDEGRADDPGRADQGRRPADDAQHGRDHADHPRRPRGHAPADADSR